MALTPLAILLFIIAGIVCFVLFTIFVMVPLFRGIGWLIGSFFTGVAWFIGHIAECIGGMIGDTVRCIGSAISIVPLSLLSVLNVIIGRWSAAGHFADSVKRECHVAGACLYRVLLRRPLKLFWLHGLLEGVEQRVPEAMSAAPGRDRPARGVGQFDGYTIVGSLAGGGSGGKLYIARPDEHKRRRLVGHPDAVVIKSFALTEGSSLPQIVRESRALEAAKQLGHVLDHNMDESRFYYVMPYHPGEHLGIVTRQLHGETDGKGLGSKQLSRAVGYVRDLVTTLSHYHLGGLWHKDVKPENIIVHDARAHLVDLGLVTPLKSAMTLTTHGTEYFRDPEMVRQALRGVKVHQVDGAKFDIYAAGAVLYFMIENTFPAHGGLSRFSLKSPEALRWIVRRAMAEYNQRYDSADVMLADLQYVLHADDPFAIKPAQLPSMGGRPVEVTASQHRAAEESAVHFAQGFPQDAEPREHPPRQAEAHHAHTPKPPARPRLRVTNWWTGKYAVDGGPDAQPRSAAGSVPAADVRRTAREQIASARARAREVRARAQAHRHQVGIERQPTPAVVMIVLGSIAFLGFILYAGWPRNGAPVEGLLDGSWNVTREVKVSRSQTSIISAGSDEGAIAAPPTSQPWLLINDHPAKHDPRVQQQVAEIIQRYKDAGWHVREEEAAAEADIRRYLPTISEQFAAGDALMTSIARWDFGGILYVDAAAEPGDLPSHQRLRVRELAATVAAASRD